MAFADCPAMLAWQPDSANPHFRWIAICDKRTLLNQSNHALMQCHVADLQIWVAAQAERVADYKGNFSPLGSGLRQ
jgi:hypothetical protein